MNLQQAYDAWKRTGSQSWTDCFLAGRKQGRTEAFEACHDIALAVDSGRGNEKEIAKGIHIEAHLSGKGVIKT